MLTSDYTTQKNAIEELICKPLQSDLAKRENVYCDKEHLMFIIAIHGIESDLKSNANTEKHKEILEQTYLKQHIFLVLKKRAQFLELKISDLSIVYLIGFNGSLGSNILLLYYLKFIQKQKKKDIDVDFLNRYVFPLGFPTDEILNRYWDNQKVKSNLEDSVMGYASDNLIDYHSASISLFE